MLLKEDFGYISNNNMITKNLATQAPMVLGTEPLTFGQYAFKNETLHVNALDGKKSSYIRIQFKKLCVGDIIEVEYDVRNITGVLCKQTIAERFDATTTKSTSDTQSTKTGEWETIKTKYVVKNKYYDGDHDLTVGVWYGNISEFYIRNFRWKVSKKTERVQPEISQHIACSVLKNASGKWEFHSPSYNIGGVSISAEDTETLVLKWDERFNKYPVCVISGDYESSSYLYTPLTGYSYENSVKVKFKEIVGGAYSIALLSSIPNYTRFSLVIVGLD